jgi:hypothetical protein
MRLASPALPVHYGYKSSAVTTFRPEVAVKLKTYVYRLIDPRNGENFCVDKGQGNQAFAHIHEHLDGDDPSNKLRHIRDIHLAVSRLRMSFIATAWRLVTTPPTPSVSPVTRRAETMGSDSRLCQHCLKQARYNATHQ